MPKIYATVSEKIENTLKNISQKNNTSFSKTVHKMIELGIYAYLNQQNMEEFGAELQSNPHLKHTEYLLRILNINCEILRKLYNEPSRCTEKTVALMLDEITCHVKKSLKEHATFFHHHQHMA